MSSPSPRPLLVVGAGEMAGEYLRALQVLGRLEETRLHGRGRERAEALGKAFGVPATWGGTPALAGAAAPRAGIVAVDHGELPGVTLELARGGCSALLLEKPGALSAAGLARVEEEVERRGARVHVAYNRRFYRSVDVARRAIAEDGGVVACSFEFTEIAQRVLADGHPRPVLERMGIVNSVHVIDLAFHLAGEPVDLTCHRSGTLDWHPAGAAFAGSGRSATGALLTYLATWNGAGSWCVEVTTPRRRLELRPLERVQARAVGAFVSEPVDLEPEPDGTKPGLVAEVSAFLDTLAGESPDPRLCPLAEGVTRLRQVERIFGYDE